MKKIYILVVLLTTSILAYAFAPQTLENPALDDGAEQCCLNGYSTWKDPHWLWGPGSNFQDCQCNYKKGRNPTPCAC